MNGSHEIISTHPTLAAIKLRLLSLRKFSGLHAPNTEPAITGSPVHVPLPINPNDGGFALDPTVNNPQHSRDSSGSPIASPHRWRPSPEVQFPHVQQPCHSNHQQAFGPTSGTAIRTMNHYFAIYRSNKWFW